MSDRRDTHFGDIVTLFSISNAIKYTCQKIHPRLIYTSKLFMQYHANSFELKQTKQSNLFMHPSRLVKLMERNHLRNIAYSMKKYVNLERLF